MGTSQLTLVLLRRFSECRALLHFLVRAGVSAGSLM
jgi:hypothetical protein